MAEQQARNGSEEEAQGPVRVERIEDTPQFKELKLTATEPSKAATARILALILMFSFAGVLIASFAIGTYILHRSFS